MNIHCMPYDRLVLLLLSIYHNHYKAHKSLLNNYQIHLQIFHHASSDHLHNFLFKTNKMK